MIDGVHPLDHYYQTMAQQYQDEMADEEDEEEEEDYGLNALSGGLMDRRAFFSIALHAAAFLYENDLLTVRF